MLPEKIKNVALSYVGKTETSGNSGFSDPVFQKKMQATGWQKGYPWCAFYAELVVTEAFRALGRQLEVLKLETIFSGSAVETYTRFKAAGFRTIGMPNLERPKVGDLVVWRLGNGWQGHIGVVVGLNKDGSFATVEGNTNANGGREGNAVAQKKRWVGEPFNAKGLNLIGFVTLE